PRSRQSQVWATWLLILLPIISEDYPIQVGRSCVGSSRTWALVGRLFHGKAGAICRTARCRIPRGGSGRRDRLDAGLLVVEMIATGAPDAAGDAGEVLAPGGEVAVIYSFF